MRRQGRKRAPPSHPPPPPAPTAADFRPLDPDNMLGGGDEQGAHNRGDHAADRARTCEERIKTLVKQHFYDGQTFFRVIEDFMDQTGDPKNTGEGGSTLPNLKGEFSFRRDASAPFVVAATPDDGPVGFVGVMPVASQPDDMMAMTADGKGDRLGPCFCPGVMGMARANEPDTAQ